jgi:FAD/FMN-containing dehydrogenase
VPDAALERLARIRDAVDPDALLVASHLPTDQ